MGEIAAAGPDAQVTIPAGTPVIDGRGATLLPGLWEMHAHLAQVEYGPAYLAAGVTIGARLWRRVRFHHCRRARPRSISTTASARACFSRAWSTDSGTGTFGTTWADTPEQGLAVVAKYHAGRISSRTKIYTRIQPDVLAAPLRRRSASPRHVGHRPRARRHDRDAGR